MLRRPGRRDRKQRAKAGIPEAIAFKTELDTLTDPA